MEAELRRNKQPIPGLTTADHGHAALDVRESTCYSGGDENVAHRTNEGLYHTGAPGCDQAQFDGTKESTEKQIFTLNSAVMAVGEGNYGRLGPDQQGRYLDANTKLQLPNPDEQPGAMPEIAPSPAYRRSINIPFEKRAMVLQAWGAYGTVWPVVHQHLGVRPDLGRNKLEVTPQVPAHWPGASVENLRLGDGSVAVAAHAEEQTYRTTVTPDLTLRQLVLGHVVPADKTIMSVMLNGAETDYETRETNRGRELLVEATTEGTQTLTIETGR
ncbi:hypothetical protein [Halomicrococcus sp. NG-SE-24]|uniref:hypothetical protein n=1 Tax=Halomicrococcus sp. NG-SE-24 TaxID=3436928 RepID=UPI003D979ABE